MCDVSWCFTVVCTPCACFTVGASSAVGMGEEGRQAGSHITHPVPDITTVLMVHVVCPLMRILCWQESELQPVDGCPPLRAGASDGPDFPVCGMYMQWL